MLNEKINEFMEKIEILNKDISKYTDEEKGRMFCLNTIQLLARVDYLELDKQEYMKATFEKKVEDLEYNVIDIDRPVPKNTITKKDADKFTIVNSKVKVKQIYNVSNGIGIYKSFANKTDAFNLANEINAKILEYLK